MDCPEGCKDAWDCCRLSNIECYVRCGQSVDRAWIFLSVTTRCMWQLGGPVHYKIHDKECLLQRTPLLCFGHSILVHCRYILELRSAVCTPAPDTAPIFKTKLQNFKLLSSQSRCTASMPSDAEKDSNWAERIEGQELANDEADIYESFKSTPGSNSVWRPRVSRE